MWAADAAADHRLRAAAFEWLREQVEIHGDVLPRSILTSGFLIDGRKIPLIAPQQGIFKPKSLTDAPLSILTTLNSPYKDAFGGDGLLRYSYRGTDPQHADNRGLRRAMALRVPLAYFHGVLPGKYVAAWPVFIVGDDPQTLRFTVALDDASHVGVDLSRLADGSAVAEADTGADARRAYITTTFRARLHQRAFRERVLLAYRSQCALCKLRHQELLDAAHIIGDLEEDGGEPVVPNGLSLCKLHHAAYDKQFLTVRPDYIIEVRQSLLDEEDGPMLLHGLKAMHGQRIVLPRSHRQHPDPERLERRYRLFRQAG